MKERHYKIIAVSILFGISLFFFVWMWQERFMPTQPSCNGHTMSIHDICYRPLDCSNAGQYGGTCIDPHNNTYAQELNEEIQEKQLLVFRLLILGVMPLFIIILIVFEKNPVFIAVVTAIHLLPSNISSKFKQLMQQRTPEV